MKRNLLFLCMMLCSVISSYAQGNIITGVVDDNTGYNVLGAVVLNVSSQKAVTTDINGRYEISATEGDELQFSYVGMKAVIKIVGVSNIVNVRMEEETQLIDEVVVIGYGTSTKKDLTGSIASIKLDESPVLSIPNANVLESIKGSLPGINIGMTTSAGGTPSYTIRGTNSISAGTTPLIVVDGVIGGDFSQINPQDIASIDVLKDASSAAVYGSRAANGVIIVTTKRGKTGAPEFSFNVTTGVNAWTRQPDMMDGEQYMKLRTDNLIASGLTGTDLEPQYFLNSKEYLAYMEDSQYNWFDETSQLGSTQNYQISISGADEKYNYYISANHYIQEGIMIGDDFKRTSVLAKVEAKFNDYIKAGINVGGSMKDYSGVSPSMYTATYISPYGYMNSTEEGYEKWLERYPSGNTTWANPLWQTFGVDNKDIRYNANLKAFVELKLPKVEGLSLRVNASYDVSQTQQANFTHEENYVNTLVVSQMKDPSMFLSSANGYSQSSNSNSWLVNQILNYNRKFGEHRIDATFMSERQRSHSNGLYVYASDFSEAGTSVLGYNSLELGDNTKRSIDTWKSQSSQLAYMLRLNYVWKDRYHATASYRRDGYSAFGEGNKFGNFSSVALAWTLSQEEFFKSNMINYLKLRVSYGENGNPSISSYSTFPSVSSGSYIFDDEYVKSLYQSKIVNKSLGWERTSAINVGVDFGLFKDVLTGNIEYYKSNTTDLLVSRSIPIMTGYSSILDNMGKLSNWGLELSLNSRNIDNGEFRWTSGFSFWMNRNKVVSLYGIDSDGDGREDDDVSNGWFIGESLGAIYSYTSGGIVQQSDVEYMEKYNASPGDLKILDINGPDGVPDGSIDSTYDRSIIGYTDPKFSMNLRNTFNYKKFELYFSLNYINGGKNGYLASNEKGFVPGKMPNANWIDEEYWTAETPSNISPRANYDNSTYSYGFYQSREFLRLQDLTLSYTFNSDMLKKTNFIKSLKMFVSGKNLLTLTSWRGLDPEAAQRIGEGSPSFKVYSAGLNITF